MIERMYEHEFDFSNCTNMDAYNVRLLALMRGLTGAVCLLVCVVTIFFLIRKRDLVKTLRDSTQARLMGYLFLSTTVYLMVLSTHLEHYWNYDGSGNNKTERKQWQVGIHIYNYHLPLPSAVSSIPKLTVPLASSPGSPSAHMKLLQAVTSELLNGVHRPPFESMLR